MEDYIYAYVAGAFAWAFLMSLLGERVDKGYLIRMAVWPVQAVSMAGQLIRKAFGKKPFA